MNQAKNRLTTALNLGQQAVNRDRSDAEWDKFSLAGNVRTERAYAVSNMQFSRASIASDEPAPTTENGFDLSGYAGLHGYLTGAVGLTATVTLWVKDTQNSEWYSVGSVAGVVPLQEFRFADGVRGRTVFLQFTSITNGPITNARISGE